MCLLWIWKTGYSAGMSFSPDSHGISPVRLYGGRVFSGCPAFFLVAERRDGRGRSARFFWKRSVSDGRMFFPDPPAGHVYQLYACSCGSSAAGSEKEGEISAAGPGSDISVQLLFRPGLFSRTGLVLV